MDTTQTPTRVRVVVASTVMLSFISFWRAAAIVLNDLGSSAFYAGGIAEGFVGPAAPWFILGVMLFSLAVRGLYIESSSMFTRGGVYRVVKEAMGGNLAKLSVSAMIFDYMLTGPISGVSAGLYFAGLLNELMPRFGVAAHVPENITAMAFAIAVTLYFWRRNIKGIQESSGDALRIMYVTTVMVVMMIGWSILTILVRGGKLPPLPVPENLSFLPDALGWLEGLGWWDTQTVQAGAEAQTRYVVASDAPSIIAVIGLFVAFGHSVLAMSGEETLAQVNREIEYPKLKNLKRAALVIFIYSLTFTSAVSFFASAIIPDETRPQYLKNLISGLAMNFVGPDWMKLLFQIFVVVVGFLMLSGAVNTAIIGSSAVLNRISEDGVLTDWFRAPHRKYGTSYRIVNIVVVLQIITILISDGNIFYLGEAYAFGVIWSFTFNAFATTVLRFKRPEGREWRMPVNLRAGRFEIPVGVLAVTVVLVITATVNLFTKQIATVAGATLTMTFFTLFLISERYNRRKQDLTLATLDRFQLQQSETVDQQTVGSHPGNVLVAVRDYNTLSHLEQVLNRVDTEEQDIVVMTVRLVSGPDYSSGEAVDESSSFTEYEQKLFTRVVALAEKAGKPVDLVVVPAVSVPDAVAQTAVRLDSAEIVSGLSSKMSAQEQARQLGKSWEALREKPRREVKFRIIEPDGEHVVSLGAHAPELTEDDVALIHKIWLQVSNVPGRRRVHHRDVVRVALNRLERELRGHSDVMLDFYKLEHEDEKERARRQSDGSKR